MILKGLRAAQKARLGSLWAGKGVSLPLPSSTRQPLSLQFRSNGMTAFYSTSSPPPSDEGKPPQNSPVPSAQEKVTSPPISFSQPLTASFNPASAKQQGSASTQSPGVNDSAATEAPNLKHRIPQAEHDYELLYDMAGYVDKTFFARQIISKQVGSALYTMPRRSGKSAIKSMLNKCFFYLPLKYHEMLLNQHLELVRRLVSLQQKIIKKQNQRLLVTGSIEQWLMIKEQVKTLEQNVIDTKAQIEKIKEKIKIESLKTTEFDRLFKGKIIYKDKEFRQGRHRYPTINIQLRSQQNILQNIMSCAEVIKSLKKSVSTAYQQHSYLMQSLRAKIEMPSTGPERKQSLERDLALFKRIHDYRSDHELLFTDSQFKDSIFLLSRLLHDHWSEYWGKEAKPLILVDQYDGAYIENLGKSFQPNIFQLLDSFYSSFIKGPGEKHRTKVVMMGIAPVKYSNVFSPTNNLMNFSLCSKTQPFFGFTTEEVKEKLRLVLHQRKQKFSEENFNDQFDILKDWCNGYWISDREMYNPWSVNSCLKQILTADKLPFEDFKSEWVKSGHMSLIQAIIKNSRDGEEKEIIKFFQNGLKHQSEDINMDRWLPFDQLTKMSSLFFLLFHTGYLTKHQTQKDVYVVPNKEILRQYFSWVFPALLEKRYPNISLADLENKSQEILDSYENLEKFCQLLQKLLNFLKSLSSENLMQQYKDQQKTESILKSLEIDIMLSLYSEQAKSLINKKHGQRYLITRQRDAGEGKKMDRFMTSSFKDTAIIHQDKIAQTESGAKRKIVEALDQIMEKYLEHVLDKQLKPHVKNIQIAGIVSYYKEIQKQDKTKGKKSEKKAKKSIKEIKVIGKGFTFTIEKARELLKEYREKFGGLETGDICNQGNQEKREEFLEMLARYQKTVEKKK